MVCVLFERYFVYINEPFSLGLGYDEMTMRLRSLIYL
jgi:hypothetical protein